MLFPERRFGLVNNSNNLFDYLFSDPVFNVNTTTNRMSTDIKEKENGYELSINKYKEIEYEEVHYDSPQEIMLRIRELELNITTGIEELAEMIGE